MAGLLATVNLHNVSGLPADDCVNTFAFVTPTGDNLDAAALAIEGALNEFYITKRNTPESVTDRAVSEFFSNELSRTANPTFKCYEIQPAGEPMGSPIRSSELFDLQPAADPQRFPTEVAVCLSFHADLTDVLEEAPDGADADDRPDRPRSRHRGRVYLGPLNGFCIADSDGHPRPSAEFQSVITLAAAAMNTPGMLAQGVEWAVWSRKDNVVRSVTGCWVDNTFDTQRRRGVQATGRTTAVVAGA